VFAVVDADGAVEEWNEANNDYAQTVRVVPGWVPRVVEVRVVGGTNTVLTFEADGYATSAFIIESSPALSMPIVWGTESDAVITTNALGKFEAQIRSEVGSRFYRVLAP
jgi:hypothetical protein